MPVLLAILIVTIALIGCNQNNTPPIKQPTALQLAEFSRNASITLPASAHAIGWHEENGIDDAMWLQVRIPTKDLPRFLESSPFRGIELSTNDTSLFYLFQMFVATPPTKYRVGQQQLPSGRYLTLMIDESATPDLIVYLMWNET